MEMWIYCPVFDKKIPLGLCVEVDAVINDGLDLDQVPELVELMKEKNYSMDTIKKLHAKKHSSVSES